MGQPDVCRLPWEELLRVLLSASVVFSVSFALKGFLRGRQLAERGYTSVSLADPSPFLPFSSSTWAVPVAILA